MALALALLLFAPRDALGQTARDVPEAPAASNWKADPLFPPRHHGSVALATGVPFVGMAEAAYAPFERFAVGALVGATPNVLGLGLRPRFGVPIGERVRVSLVVPMLYYPTGAGLIGNGPPWFLAQPAIRAEHAIGDRGYAFAGAGLIGVFGNRPKDESTETVATYNGRQVVDKGTPWGFWNTVSAGGAVLVAERTTVFVDATLVFRGLQLAGDEWVGGPPLAFALGVARVL